MALSLFTVPGAKWSNSLITVDEADDYIADSPYDSAAWDALDENAKTYRLILAMKYMKSRFEWLGWLIFENQTLPWPRWFPEEGESEVYVPDDVSLEIPDDIKRAQAYIAYAVIHRGLVGISDPGDGSVAEPEIKSLSLFGRMSVTAADAEMPTSKTDQSIFERLIASEYFHIGLLLEDWVSGVSMLPWKTAPVKLAAVAMTL